MEKYNESKPYQNMNNSQKSIMDHIESGAFCKRFSQEEVGKWKAKRDNTTDEELKALEEKAEQDRKRGKWFLIGFGIIILAIAGIFQLWQ